MLRSLGLTLPLLAPQSAPHVPLFNPRPQPSTFATSPRRPRRGCEACAGGGRAGVLGRRCGAREGGRRRLLGPAGRLFGRRAARAGRHGLARERRSADHSGKGRRGGRGGGFQGVWDGDGAVCEAFGHEHIQQRRWWSCAPRPWRCAPCCCCSPRKARRCRRRAQRVLCASPRVGCSRSPGRKTPRSTTRAW